MLAHHLHFSKYHDFFSSCKLSYLGLLKFVLPKLDTPKAYIVSFQIAAEFLTNLKIAKCNFTDVVYGYYQRKFIGSR